MADRASRTRTLLLVAPGVLWLLIFSVLPLALLGVMSLWTSSIFGLSTELTLDNYRTVLSEPVYGRVLLHTLRIAAITTIVSLLISYPMAYFLATLKGTAKTLCLLLLFMPFRTSHLVRPFVWLPMLGRNGLINSCLIQLGIIAQPLDWLLYNEGAVYVGFVYVYTLFMTLPIYLSLDRLDPALIEAATDLGAGPCWTLTLIVIPLSLPGVLSGCVMVFFARLRSLRHAATAGRHGRGDVWQYYCGPVSADQ